MEILIMNDAADKIIKIFRLYIIRLKYHQTKLAVTRRYSKNTQSSTTGYSYRSFGSNESWNSNSGSGKSNLNGTANQLRKRSDNSFSSSNSVDKKSQNSASKSSKYFTTKNFKGFASKLLYGKPKSPIDMKGSTKKESSKILQRGQDEFNSVEYDNREYHESLKSGRPRKCSISKIDKLDDISDTSSPPSKINNTNKLKDLKELKNDNSPTSTSNLMEIASDNNLRKNGGDITPKQNMRLVGKSLSTSAINHTRPQLVTQSSSISTTNSTSTSTSAPNSTSISSSSFFSIHENRTKMNKELKDKSKTNYKVIKALRKEKIMKAKEDSFVLVAQKAYCLISSEEMQSSQFQVMNCFLFLLLFIYLCYILFFQVSYFF